MINTVIMNVDILRTDIFWSKETSGCFNLLCLWTDHQFCDNKNSKPSCSTILRLISIQHRIRCPRDQCRHSQCRYFENEHILIKEGIRMGKIFGCLWTDHQCCGSKNSKPSSFSTNLRPIYIQHSIRCTRDQCRHCECWFSENEHKRRYQDV